MREVRSLSGPAASLLIFLSLFMVSLSWFSSNQAIGVLARLLPLLTGLGYLTYIRIKHRRSYRHSLRGSGLLFTIFVFYQAGTLLLTPLPELGVPTVLDGVYALISFGLMLALLDTGFRPEWFETGLLLTAAVFALANLPSVLQWWLGWAEIQGSYLSVPPISFRLPGAFLSHPNIEAAFINLAIPLALYRLLNKPSRAVKLLIVILLFLFAGVEYFASSRGAWVALAFSLVITGTLIAYAQAGSLATLIRQVWTHVRSRAFIPRLALAIAAAYLLSILLGGQVDHPSHAPAGLSRSGIWHIGIELFKTSPLFGNGAGSFHYLSVSGAGIPPGFFLVHAHNLLLQIGAELGLAGLIITATLGLVATWTWISVWRKGTSSSRIRLAAYAGALSTVLIHGMVDFPFEAPVFTVAVILLLALVEHANPVSPKRTLSTGKAILYLTLCVAVLGVVGGWQIRGAHTFNSGLAEFEAANYQTASDKICQASSEQERETFYAFQCALALSVLADRSNEPELLNEAVVKLSAGIDRDPYWPGHIANIAALEFELGRTEEALWRMTTALDQAPRNATFALNLGRMYELIGDQRAAEDAYAHAIELDPWIYRSYFMTQTDLRRGVLRNVNKFPFLNEVQALTWQGWVFLDRGELIRAIEAFEAVLSLNPGVGDAHAGLAVAQQRLQMDPGTIAKELRLARFFTPASPLVLDVLGLTAMQESQVEPAAGIFWRMFEILSHPNASREYYASTYHRSGLPIDMVPQLQQNPVPIEMLNHIRWLADYYDKVGETDRAGMVRAWVQGQTE